jgi:hypothetical protein
MARPRKQNDGPADPPAADPFEALLAQAVEADVSAYVVPEALDTFTTFIQGCVDRGLVGRVLYLPGTAYPKEQAGNPGWRYKKAVERTVTIPAEFTVATKSGPAAGDLSKSHRVVGLLLKRAEA